MKTCTRCRESKPFTEFWKNRCTTDGYQSQCKACHYLSVKKNLDGPDREKYLRMRKNRNLMRTYGITLELYEEFVATQRGVCWICHEPNPDGRALAVDHDHECCPGERSCGRCIRGLLCSLCNQGIGMFHEDSALLTAAIDYVERSKMARDRRDLVDHGR